MGDAEGRHASLICINVLFPWSPTKVPEGVSQPKGCWGRWAFQQRQVENGSLSLSSKRIKERGRPRSRDVGAEPCGSVVSPRLSTYGIC